ncbi:auxin efflux carrier [Phanerochaete sordida]|uniref:Auxin efflux carrier n=1 Tax=Phanerochaete sordida TaxID=48140 RepID=A0A9P3G4A7_9APHY|nr:auxin efflux carrier [Phanerochaete sordida]
MPSAGFLIYSGVMPLIKTFISIFCGYFLAKKGLFTPAASKGASQITMNVSLPLLVFANIVPAFTPQNISALGPLFLTAFVYMALGFLGGAVIREVCYVPRNFWQGIIVLTGMSNWGNLPNAVVLSVTQQAPFDPSTDPQLGVSFVSIFIVSYHLVFWVCGAAHSLSWDYLPGVPQGEEAERRCSWDEKPLGSLFARYILRKPCTSAEKAACDSIPGSPVFPEEKKSKDPEAAFSVAVPEQPYLDDPTEADPDVQLVRRLSRLSALPAPHAVPELSRPVAAPDGPHDSGSVTAAPSVASLGRPRSFPASVVRTLRPLAAIVNPVTIAIAIALPIALVQDLKALFVDIASEGGPRWHGPDGKPPLAFIIDTASFVGNIAVPLALIMLGASFARLRVPRPLSRLPLPAMLAVALVKMALLPVVGVFMVQGMTARGLIDRASRAERFVAMFLSGTPAAVNQMIVASLYAPDGDVDTLSAFLLVQYIFMFFSSSALTAVALLLL